MIKMRRYAWVFMWLCCLTLAGAAPDKEHKTANGVAMRKAPKAGRVSESVPAVNAVAASSARMRAENAPSVPVASASAGVASNDVAAVLSLLKTAVSRVNATGVVCVALSAGSARAVGQQAPVIRRLDGIVTVAAFNYVFAWREDTPLLFPELEVRPAASDSYFGYLERRIAAACEAGDFENAGGLVRQYVYEWDNVYKVNAGRAQPVRGFRRGLP